MAAVVATPLRFNKRKLQHYYEEEMFPDVFGVKPLQVDKLDNIQEELSALHRLDNKARVNRPMERKERKKQVFNKRILREEEASMCLFNLTN